MKNGDISHERDSACIAFGRRLQRVIRQQGMTLAEVGRHLGIQPDTRAGDRIGKYVHGVSYPHPHVLIELASLLGVSVDYLLTGKEVQSATGEGMQSCDDCDWREVAGNWKAIAERHQHEVERLRIIIDDMACQKCAGSG